MTLLALETATSVCAAALIRNGVVITEHSVELPRVHSEKLLLLVDGACSTAGISIDSVDAFVVSIGPGSFTGLRIGLSVAKGLSYSLDKPLVAVPTLEALAYHTARSIQKKKHEWILPMIDARRDDVYCAVYRDTGCWLEEIAPAHSTTLDGVMKTISGYNEVLITGDAVEKYQKYTRLKRFGPSCKITIPPQDHLACRASSVGLLGEHRFTRGEAADISSLEPFYVKDFYPPVHPYHESAN